MKKLIFLCSFILITVALNAQQYPGTNIQGQILTTNQGYQVALVNAKVDLYFFNPATQQLQYMATSYTNGYGFFAFNLVPVNNYVFYVNGLKSYNIQVIFIDYRFYQFQNLGTFFY